MRARVPRAPMGRRSGSSGRTIGPLEAAGSTIGAPPTCQAGRVRSWPPICREQTAPQPESQLRSSKVDHKGRPTWVMPTEMAHMARPHGRLPLIVSAPAPESGCPCLSLACGDSLPGRAPNPRGQRQEATRQWRRGEAPVSVPPRSPASAYTSEEGKPCLREARHMRQRREGYLD